MKWLPAKFGAEPKKLGVLGALVLVAGWLAWSNLHNSGDATGAAATKSQQAPDAPASPAAEPARVAEPARLTRRRSGRDGERSGLEDFRPSLKRARALASDPTKVDPTLRLDLLAKLQGVSFEGNMRSLFDYGQALAPPVKEPKTIVPGPAQGKPMGPQPLPPPAPPPQPPPPPAIPLKFYGFVNPARTNIKRAFFLDGEDILVASEGDTIHNRYKIVRIGVNSAVVEDTQFKNQQTLPLVAEDQG